MVCTQTRKLGKRGTPNKCMPERLGENRQKIIIKMMEKEL